MTRQQAIDKAAIFRRGNVTIISNEDGVYDLRTPEEQRRAKPLWTRFIRWLMP